MAEVNPNGPSGGSNDMSSDEEPPKSDSLNRWTPKCTDPRPQRRCSAKADLIYRQRNRAREDQKSRRLRRKMKRRIRELEYANRTKMALIKKPKQRHPGESSLHIHFGGMSIEQPSTSRDMPGPSTSTSTSTVTTTISTFENQANQENSLNMISGDLASLIIEIDEDTHT